MPVYETSNHRLGWPQIVAWGCGGCAFLGVILCVAAFFGIRYYASYIMGLAMTPPPPRTKLSPPYSFGSGSQAAHCQIALPNNQGTLTYSHILPNASGYWGARAVKVKDSLGKSQTWPLPYSHLKDVKVGVYWYPAKNGLGPFIRFYDATGSSMLDLATKEVGQLFVIHGQSAIANYAYDDSAFQGCSSEKDGKGRITAATDAYGNPARNVSATVTPANCKYLGSIVRKGNTLVFKPK